MRILKFPLAMSGLMTIETADRPRILGVGPDKSGEPKVWVEAEEGKDTVTVFYTAFTGDAVPDRKHYTHIGSFGIDGNSLILHIYVWHPSMSEWDPRKSERRG